MDNCEGKCDCDAPGGYPHDPDCRSLDKCDGENGQWCEKHWQEQLYENGWMKGRPLSSVTGVLSREEKLELCRAGRGHLVLL